MLKLNKRYYLISGAAFVLIGLVFAFPLDKLMNSGSLIKFAGTCSFLGIGLLILLFGFMKKGVLKAILLITFSAFLSYVSWFYYTGSGWLSSTIAFWTGIPIGILSALLYLILNHYFLSKKSRKQSFLNKLPYTLSSFFSSLFWQPKVLTGYTIFLRFRPILN